MRGQYAIALEIADRRHGRAHRDDLLAAGVDPKRIERWLADGRLRIVHRGVYAVGHAAPSVLGDYTAAVLAGGAEASLSHAPVVHVLRLLPGGPPPPEITVPTKSHRSRPGIVIHRVTALHRLDRDTFRGIPITSVSRTLLDMAPRLHPSQLTRACHEAWVRHQVTPAHIQACIARNPAKPGRAKLLAAAGSDATLSGLEDAFAELLRKYGLPPARMNVDYHGDKVDCHWPHLGLTVELVSYRFHASRKAFEDDVARRRRSNHIAFTWGDVFERPGQTVAELSRAIAAGA